MRCLTLAGELKRGGAEVRFAVNSDACRFVPSLEQAGYAVATVATMADTPAWPDRMDAIVCDSYELNSNVERTLRSHASRIVVIDDLADRPHDCDALIDSSWGRSITDYRDLVPAGTLVLTGPRYAPLRSEFAASRHAALIRRSTGAAVARVLVSMGLTDVGGITARIVTGLLATPVQARLQAQLDVVIGSLAESRDALEALAHNDRRVRLHIDPPDMARLMTNADLAIGAGGTTTWERCCLGLPTVLVVLADNQRPGAVALERAGAAKIVPAAADANLRTIASLAVGLADNTRARTAMAAAAAAIVDGKGVERVCQSILALIRNDPTAELRR
jgi:UDP-2,4-diacetamido-2,4,6-trideoxy-beta-L-altropyranose hydrolase